MITLEKLCFLAGRKDSLFQQLVASLLNDLADNLKLHESEAGDIEGLLNEVAEVEPDMILLEDSSPFSQDSLLVQLLIDRPNLPVIVISEDSNVMHVVRRETMLISSSSDLIKTINLIEVQPEKLGR